MSDEMHGRPPVQVLNGQCALFPRDQVSKEHVGKQRTVPYLPEEPKRKALNTHSYGFRSES